MVKQIDDSVTRYACDLNQCAQSSEGVLMLHSEYEKRVAKLIAEHEERYEKLTIMCRILRSRLIDLTQSRDWYQAQLDLKAFTGL